MAQVGIAWLLAQPTVTAPLIGTTKVKHVLDAVAALDVRLSEGDIPALETSYRPHEPSRVRAGGSPLQRRDRSV